MTSNAEKTRRRWLIAGKGWPRLNQMPLPEVEHSILLRVLTQVLVSIGIIANDLAAETQASLWAIPLSAVGAYWSWQSRRRHNVATKFCIAIGMLGALAAFFVELRSDSGDTRLVLARLLVYLQVLHSFHMPRRQDLGYSMMIGLILISVASTLSQTMVFGLGLLAFLAIALPVLVLDYRSRLGLLGQHYRSPLRHASLSPKQLGGFLALILGLGMAIFLSLPRLPGYQLRTFPVSEPTVQEEVDSRQIINPGYVRGGNGRDGTGEGGQGTEPGQVDETFYYGFNSRINQNLRGQMKPQLVMRVRSQVEGFWRVLAFDRYLGQGWEISRAQELKDIERPTWSYQFFIPRPVAAGLTREAVQTYTIVSDLPNLLPMLSYPRELYFPAPKVTTDAEGNIRSPVGLSEGLTYTVISDVPYRNRSRLRQVGAKYPESIRKHYLDVPTAILASVRKETERLLATSPQPITAPYEKALFLAQALKQRYSIQYELPPLKENEDLVSAFLFQHQGGYPDHFSTTLTIMLRSIGIPARLVAGFAPGQFNPFTGLYEVWNTDAYAVTEVFFPRYGWYTFDPIPGHELFPPSIEEDQTFSVLQRFWQWIAGWIPSPVSNLLGRLLGGIFAAVVGAIAWFMGLFSQGWQGVFIALLVMLLVAFLGWLLWQGWRRWQHARRLAALPPMERLYQQMLHRLASLGMGKQPAQTPLEYARHMQTNRPTEQAQAIATISQAYVHWRYGGQTPDLERLKQQLRIFQQTTRRKP